MRAVRRRPRRRDHRQRGSSPRSASSRSPTRSRSWPPRSRARRPQFPRWAFYLPIVGGVLFGVAWIAYGIGRVERRPLAARRPGTIDDGPGHRRRPASPGPARCCCSPAALALAVGIVLVSLNAMRTGLLTRFMGALGIVVGDLPGHRGRRLAAARADVLARRARRPVRRPPARAATRPRGAPAAPSRGRPRSRPPRRAARASRPRRRRAEPDARAGPSPSACPAGAHPADVEAQAQAPRLSRDRRSTPPERVSLPQHCRFS